MVGLISYVHIRDREHGPLVLAPGDEVPAWAVKHIRNPKAWEGGEVPPVPAGQGAAPPPHSGPGSGRSAWAAWAADHQVPVTDAMSRDQIIEACEAAGVPTE